MPGGVFPPMGGAYPTQGGAYPTPGGAPYGAPAGHGASSGQFPSVAYPGAIPGGGQYPTPGANPYGGVNR